MKYLILIFLSMNVYSQWLPDSIEFFSRSAQIKASLTDASTVTMWGGFQRSLSFPLFKGEEISLSSELFKTGSFKIYLRQNITKSPLIVFMPGIFGSYNSSITGIKINELETLNAHILVPPNFLHHEYVAAGPDYTNFQTDENLDLVVAREALNYAIKKIGIQNIDKIHFIGESLGTIIASALFASELPGNQKLDQGSLTLICPPLKLSVSVNQFDKLISEFGHEDQACSSFYTYPLMLYHFLYQEDPNNMDVEFQNCMKNYLYRNVFLGDANKTLKGHYKLYKIENRSLAKNFTDFFSKYQPSFLQKLKSNDTQTVLANWLKLAVDNNRSKIRILSSDNDFVNLLEDWDEFFKISKIKKNQAIILPWGGHCAIFGVDGWAKIFESELKIKKGT